MTETVTATPRGGNATPGITVPRVFTTAGVLLGWIVANIHLRWIDPLFLKRGKVDRLLKLPSR